MSKVEVGTPGAGKRHQVPYTKGRREPEGNVGGASVNIEIWSIELCRFVPMEVSSLFQRQESSQTVNLTAPRVEGGVIERRLDHMPSLEGMAQGW